MTQKKPLITMRPNSSLRPLLTHGKKLCCFLFDILRKVRCRSVFSALYHVYRSHRTCWLHTIQILTTNMCISLLVTIKLQEIQLRAPIISKQDQRLERCGASQEQQSVRYQSLRAPARANFTFLATNVRHTIKTLFGDLDQPPSILTKQTFDYFYRRDGAR